MSLRALHCDLYHHEARLCWCCVGAVAHALRCAQFVREVMMRSAAATVDRCAGLLVSLHCGGTVSSASLRHGMRRTLRELRAGASIAGGAPANAVAIISALVNARCVSMAEVGDAFSAADDDDTESVLLAEMYERLAW